MKQEINRKILTIDNMVNIIQDLTFQKGFNKLIVSKKMKSLMELNPDFDCPESWYVNELEVNEDFLEKEFELQ
jgi:hypothetical protein